MKTIARTWGNTIEPKHSRGVAIATALILLFLILLLVPIVLQVGFGWPYLLDFI